MLLSPWKVLYILLNFQLSFILTLKISKTIFVGTHDFCDMLWEEIHTGYTEHNYPWGNGIVRSLVICICILNFCIININYHYKFIYWFILKKIVVSKQNLIYKESIQCSSYKFWNQTLWIWISTFLWLGLIVLPFCSSVASSFKLVTLPATGLNEFQIHWIKMHSTQYLAIVLQNQLSL